MTIKFNPLSNNFDIDTNTFLQLVDTPSSYSLKGGYLTSVNTAETAIEFPDEITFGDITWEARTAMTTPSADELAGPYLTTSGTTPNRIVTWQIKDESGYEVILYSYKV